MSTTIPAHRLQLTELAPRRYAAMNRLAGAATLDPALKDLIDLRASQINGCAFCLDMHFKDAKARGQTDERLYMLPAWREATCYDERERAALALTESVTLIADTNVPDDVWEQAEAQFEPEELAELVFAIATINTWNRISITSRTEPGHYVPGMFG